jgi:hypothetical protein
MESQFLTDKKTFRAEWRYRLRAGIKIKMNPNEEKNEEVAADAATPETAAPEAVETPAEATTEEEVAAPSEDAPTEAAEEEVEVEEDAE